MKKEDLTFADCAPLSQSCATGSFPLSLPSVLSAAYLSCVAWLHINTLASTSIRLVFIMISCDH